MINDNLFSTYIFSWGNRSAVFYAPSEKEARIQFEEQYNVGPVTDLKIELQR